jgi:hypothetical protein
MFVIHELVMQEILAGRPPRPDFDLFLCCHRGPASSSASASSSSGKIHPSLFPTML